MEKVDVVVVDDNDSVRFVLQEVLATGDITSRGAGNGAEGLDLIARYKPSLAIVDLKLGSINGLDLAGGIRDLGGGTKVLIITGYAETILGQVDGDLPIVGVVEKPFDAFELLDLVKKILGRTS